ncbi:hypothetical protein SEVIR_8G035100v4 [Setaria viridis]|uniref:KIB1-4 beta-propeller domain-containing protein n=1 Tax=Setaria viridis TaxID=4556 RepID=A0A4U6TCZ1_SETVI|nr:hypothetical protein SEVIR_8G035100v2 [Setaria viridis]
MGTCLSKGQPRPSPQDHVPLWSDLPPEVGGLILCRLPSHVVDRLSFGPVCRQWWRLGLAEQQHLPPALPWICLNVSPSTADCPDRGRLLPRAFTGAGEVGPPTDMKDCFCSLDGCWVLYEFYGASTARVLVNASSAGAAATKVPPRRRLHDGGGTAPAVVSTASLKRKMMAPQPDGYRLGPPMWLSSLPPYTRGHGSWYQDVAFHRGKLYALTAMDDLFALEVIDGEIAGESQDEHVIKASESSSPPTTDLQEERPSKMRYLVVSSCGGKLLMVKWSVPRRLNEGTAAKVLEGIKMKVFEADLGMGRWLEVDSLGDDQALFVSRGCSRSLRLTTGDVDDERFQGNRVYFLGIDLPTCCKEALCPDYGCEACDDYSPLPSYGFYDLRSRTSSPVFLDGKTKDIIPSSAVFSAEWSFPWQ